MHRFLHRTQSILLCFYTTGKDEYCEDFAKWTFVLEVAPGTTALYQVHPNAPYHFTMSEHFVTFDSVPLWSLYSVFFTTSSVKGEQHVCTSVKLVLDEKHVRPN